VVGRPPAIAHLVPAALRIAPTPAAPSPHVRIAHLHGRRSPSLRSSSSSPPCRRRRRSPSFSPRDHERDRRSRRCDSRSPPSCRRRISPPPPPRGRTPRSPDHARCRRRPSPRRTRKGHSLSSERSPPPPRRNGASGIGVRTGAGVWRMGGTLRKGHPAGAGAGAEAFRSCSCSS
jgi:serine/arginine repetitive matrix protein 1